jgi:RNA polymerase sigma-70 factor (ECF subfamily)
MPGTNSANDDYAVIRDADSTRLPSSDQPACAAHEGNAQSFTINGSDFDEGLLARVALRDELAMAELYDLHSKLIFSVALRVLGDAATAEDVMQETFLKIWRDPNSFIAAKGSLPGWLAVVARNRSIDLLRRRRPSDQVDDLNLASRDDLEHDAEQSISLQRAWSAIGLLPQEQRRYMGLAFSQGLSYSEIAKVTGHSLGTVKTRIRMALSTLRKELQS